MNKLKLVVFLALPSLLNAAHAPLKDPIKSNDCLRESLKSAPLSPCGKESRLKEIEREGSNISNLLTLQVKRIKGIKTKNELQEELKKIGCYVKTIDKLEAENIHLFD